MSRAIEVSVLPALLEWACDRPGVEREDLEKRFRDLQRWLDGTKKPTERQLRDFAKATYTPFGEFFGTELPNDNLPVSDFRVREDGSLRRPSAHLLDTVFICQDRQDWYRDYQTSLEEPPIEWVGTERVQNSPVSAAAQFGSGIALDVQSRVTAATWEQALREAKEQLEEAGILVMFSGVVGNNNSRKLDPEEFSGFALSDRFAPLIFINSRDYKAAQMFTLAHEIGHLLLGESGVSDDSVGARRAPRNERWCDRFAAELLAPENDLRMQSVEFGRLTEADLKRLARRYKVSSWVILRRLRASDLIDSSQYTTLLSDERDRFAQRQARQKEEGSGGGDFYRTYFQRTGHRFARAVVSRTLNDEVTYGDMSRLLQIRSMETVDKLAAQLGIVQS